MRITRFIIAVVASALLASCEEKTVDNFENPLPGVPATCSQIASLAGCNQGSLSYSCTSDRPDDAGSGSGDIAQLVCSDGTLGPAGTALFCCVPFSQYFAACTPDTTVPGCGATSVGFACTSEGNPPTAPSDTDPTIACSAAQVGGDGIPRYCCNTAVVPTACALTGASCPGIGVGYDCVAGATPADNGAPLACAPVALGSDDTPFCCVPFDVGADTCTVDPTVDCAASSVPFSCSGSNTPDALDPELTCAVVGLGFCCQIQ